MQITSLPAHAPEYPSGSSSEEQNHNMPYSSDLQFSKQCE